MPVLFLLMLGVNRYYRESNERSRSTRPRGSASTGDHAIVLVGRMQKPTLKALDYAIAARHETHRGGALSRSTTTRRELLEEQWTQMNIQVPLRVIQSPYRDISFPLIKYIKTASGGPRLRGHHGLHAAVHRRALVGEPPAQPQGPAHPHKLMLCHGVTVALVPWLLDSSNLVYAAPSRPLPGQDRRGEPVRPPRRCAGDSGHPCQRPKRVSAEQTTPVTRRSRPACACREPRRRRRLPNRFARAAP